MHNKSSDGTQANGSERAVSLAPLNLEEALTALFAVPDSEATKPKNRRRGKGK